MNSSFYDLGRSGFLKHDGKSDEDDNDEHEYEESHQGIIFAIQLTPTMYENLHVIFSNILELIEELAKFAPNTGLGCYLFNCSNRPDEDELSGLKEDEIRWRKQLFMDRRGVYPIFRLSDINAHQLEKMNTIIEQSKLKVSATDDKTNSFEEMFKLLSSDPLINSGEQLSYIFNQCHDDFVYVPRFVKEYTYRKIFLFTDCDKPFNGSTSTRTTLQNIIHDLDTARIRINPFLIPQMNAGKPFDLVEYKILLEVGEISNLDQIKGQKTHYRPSIEQISLEKIREKIERTQQLRRSVFACSLVLSNTMTISIRGYRIFSESTIKLPEHFYDDQGIYKVVHIKTYKLAETSGEILNKDKVEFKKVFPVQDQFIDIDKAFWNEILQFNEKHKPLLRVIGFRDLQYYNPSYTIGKPIFVVGDDNGSFTHSNRTFSALYQALLHKNKMCLVWGMPRKLSYPSMYYMIPTDSTLEKNVPEGLMMIQIPYRDQIRLLPDYITDVLKPYKVLKQNLFERLTTKLKRNRFDLSANPQLLWHYKVLEDFILQREVEEPEALESLTEVSNADKEDLRKQIRYDTMDDMKQRIEKTRDDIRNDSEIMSLVKSLKTMLNGIANYEELHKISRNDEKDLPPSKRTKLLTDDLVIKAWKLGSLSKFSAQQLRVYINSKPNLIEKAPKKAEMIQNISEYLERAAD